MDVNSVNDSGLYGGVRHECLYVRASGRPLAYLEFLRFAKSTVLISFKLRARVVNETIMSGILKHFLECIW
jgi:hypothetical protein